MCGDRLRPSPITRQAREDVHALTGLSEATTVEATFVFADIAGFTALTEAHGDHDAAALVADFCRSVRAGLPVSGGTAVKSIGDAVMLAIPDPAAAIVLGLRDHARVDARARRRGRAGRSPSVRRSSATATTSARRSTSRHASPARQAAARSCSP
jgi:class 3 adenylate cyclase